MDFGALLHVARKNSESVKNSESKCYSTKFSAPKKETKEKRLSDNIKKFLAKKEQEEKEKARIEKEKLQRLLAMRDEKSKNKIRKMLKVTKSANKSVLEDAIDNENTAITLQGPDQPDEDDYGYVSQEAAAFYQKYMDKVKAIPEEDKFAPSKSKIRTDLSGTKDRVREAIRKEQEEKNSTHRTKLSSSKPSDLSSSSSSLSKSRKDLYDPEMEREREREEQKNREEERRKVKLKKPAPPPMDFKELLRLAEKKQHEPVEIKVEVEKEPERLLTKKQKKELEERKAYLEEREKKERGGSNHNNSSNDKSQPLNGKIPKINDMSNDIEESRKFSSNERTHPKSLSQKVSSISNLNIKNEFKKPSSTINSAPSKTKLPSNLKPNNHNEVTRIKSQLPKVNNINSSSGSSNNIRNESKSASNQTQSKSLSSTLNKSNHINTKSSALTSLSHKTSTSTKPSSGLSSSVQNQQQRTDLQKTSINNQKSLMNSKISKEIKSRPFPPRLPDKERTRQFPPSDVRSNSRPMKKPMKRRIIDDDDDEYDSELDDFIDDGPEEGSENYSSYIKEIFGYDKSRYRDIDEDDPDMESNFVQQMKEEQLSKKIGLMEDLEDMRLEAEEKRKKALIKKKKLK